MAICNECRNVKRNKWGSEYWECNLQHVANDFVSGEKLIFCRDLNKDGKCEQFVPLSIEDKLTEMNKLWFKNYDKLCEVSHMNIIEFLFWQKEFNSREFYTFVK